MASVGLVNNKNTRTIPKGITAEEGVLVGLVRPANE